MTRRCRVRLEMERHTPRLYQATAWIASIAQVSRRARIRSLEDDREEEAQVAESRLERCDRDWRLGNRMRMCMRASSDEIQTELRNRSNDTKRIDDQVECQNCKRLQVWKLQPRCLSSACDFRASLCRSPISPTRHLLSCSRMLSLFFIHNQK